MRHDLVDGILDVLVNPVGDAPLDLDSMLFATQLPLNGFLLVSKKRERAVLATTSSSGSLLDSLNHLC